MTDLRKAAEGAREFAIGQRVRKIKGSAWQGVVVGFYSTTLTPVGYAVESEREPGSVQIYPEAALKALDAALSAPAPAPGEAEGLAQTVREIEWLEEAVHMARDRYETTRRPSDHSDWIHCKADLRQTAVNALPELIATIRRLTAEKAKAERELAWTGEVHPATNAEGGGAVVHVTWDQWNGLRMLAGLSAQKATGYRVFSVAKSSLDQWKRDQAARVEAAEQRADALSQECEKLRRALEEIYRVGDGYEENRPETGKYAGTTGEGHARCRQLAETALRRARAVTGGGDA